MTPAPAAALALLAIISAALAADPPKPTDAPPAAKGHLPPHFKGLGLTADQKAQVEKITGAAAAKVADLESQIAAVREQEHKDALAVLNDDQRKALKALLTAAVDDKPLSATKDK